jgi:hypothetical protein
MGSEKSTRDQIKDHLLNNCQEYAADLDGVIRSRQILAVVEVLADELDEIWRAIGTLAAANENIEVVEADEEDEV